MARRKRHTDKPFGDAISLLMAEQNITYRGLATETGLSAGYLNHLVHGNRPVPSEEVISRLAGALGVDPSHFREVRIRVISEALEKNPELVDRLYKRLSGARAR